MQDSGQIYANRFPANGAKGSTIHPSKTALVEQKMDRHELLALEAIRKRAEFRRKQNGHGNGEWTKIMETRHQEAKRLFESGLATLEGSYRSYFCEFVAQLAGATNLRWDSFVSSLRILPDSLVRSGVLHTEGEVTIAIMSGHGLKPIIHTPFVNPHELYKPKK